MFLAYKLLQLKVWHIWSTKKAHGTHHHVVSSVLWTLVSLLFYFHFQQLFNICFIMSRCFILLSGKEYVYYIFPLILFLLLKETHNVWHYNHQETLVNDYHFTYHILTSLVTPWRMVSHLRQVILDGQAADRLKRLGRKWLGKEICGKIRALKRSWIYKGM